MARSSAPRTAGETQLVTPEQRASELLFPAEDGGLRSEHSLRKPFARARALIGLDMRFTPRGLRRTFNDLVRAAEVESLVTRSISGHLTDRMREHYTIVTPVEQRESIGRVLRLVRPGNDGGAARQSHHDAPHSGAPGAAGGAPRKVVTG